MIALSDLEGHWRLVREIEDLHAGQHGHLAGTCHWHPDAGGLRQEEDGVLRYAAAMPMRARRAYLWRATELGLAVFFDDGRPFHTLAPGRLDDRHWCDPDLYEVRYDFTAWPCWTQRWRVTGPRKDAVIVSRFQPAG